MLYSSFESSHQDESNGGKFVLLRSLDGQIFDETSKSAFYIYDTVPFDVLLNISPSNDYRRLYHSSFESAHQGESNGGKFTFYNHWMAGYLTKRQKSAFFIFVNADF